MAQVTLNIPDIVIDVLDFLDRTFGYAEELEFAPSAIEIGDIVTDHVSGIDWRVAAIHQEAPYTSLPVEYAAYTLTEAWAFLVRVTDDSAFALSDYAPLQYLTDMLSKGE